MRILKTFLLFLFTLFFFYGSSQGEVPRKKDASVEKGTFQNSAGGTGIAQAEGVEADWTDKEFDDFEEEQEDEVGGDAASEVYDPLEPYNRAMFYFNDKVYFWVFSPLMKGYIFILPETGRIGVRRFFSNITTPIRVVNSLLQLRFKAAGVELSRFVINTTIGIAGFMDPARKMNLLKKEEDLGQTLGHYGVGYGFYINLPFLGPSTLRDTLGTLGDLFLDPVMVLTPFNTVEKMAISGYRVVNEVSLSPTLYGEIVKKSFDPYTFMKSAYYQIRENQIKQ